MMYAPGVTTNSGFFIILESGLDLDDARDWFVNNININSTTYC